MFFDDCDLKDKDQLKRRYRFWVAKLHPDVGGDNNLFVKMQTEYEALLKHGKPPSNIHKAESSFLETILNNPLIQNLAADIVSRTTQHLLDGIDKTSDAIQQMIKNDKN